MPEDQETARVIDEETEAERQARLAALPPLSPDDATALQTTALLGPPMTADESRRSAIERTPWDELLRDGAVHFRCAVRSSLSHTQIIDFALQKCSPANWDALYWYRAWVAQVGAELQTREAIEDRLRVEHAAIAKAQRTRIASKGGEGKRNKSAGVVEWVQERWLAEGAEYENNKTAFGRDYAKRAKNERGFTVSVRTIADDWLSPARLAEKAGGVSRVA